MNPELMRGRPFSPQCVVVTSFCVISDASSCHNSPQKKTGGEESARGAREFRRSEKEREREKKVKAQEEREKEMEAQEN